MSEAGIVVAARMGSTRLPGKHLKPFGSGNVITSCLERCRATGLKVVMAVPSMDLVSFSNVYTPEPHVPLFGGSEHDVLARVIAAAVWQDFDPVIRVTGDCPLTEPGIIDAMMEEHRLCVGYDVDMISNVWPERSFAKGLDVEIVSLAALKKVAKDASTDEREHVTLGLYRRDEFNVKGFANTGEWADENSEPLCVDTSEDLERLRKRSAA